MISSAESLDEVVLKAVVFQRAVHASHPIATTPIMLPRRTALEGGRERLGEDEVFAEPPLRRSVESAESDRATPSFTLRLPATSLRPLALLDTGEDGAAPHVRTARATLEDAISRHEHALRLWAGEPMRHVSQALVDAVRSTPAPLAPKVVLEARPRALPTESMPSPNLIPHLPSDVAADVLRPHCQVLARGSVADLGVPIAGQRAIAAPPPPPPPRHPLSDRDKGHWDRTAKVDLLSQPRARFNRDNERREGVRVAALSLSPSPPPDSAADEANVHLISQEVGSDRLVVGAPPAAPSQYRVPLRMRRAPLSGPNLGGASTNGATQSTPAAASPRPFFEAQAERYTQWRSQQAAVLQQLAPDLWGRALPHYAAFDFHPRVMDGGCPTNASRVGKLKYDGGVVLI